MSWTKRQFVETAFEEIGYAVYAFDIQPEQLNAALRRLDSFMAWLNDKGVRLGYPLHDSPDDSDLDETTGVPDSANEVIFTNLAIRIAPSIGKTVSSETKKTASRGLNALFAKSTKPEPLQLPTSMPAGAGNKKDQQLAAPFSNSNDDPVEAGDDSVFDFE